MSECFIYRTSRSFVKNIDKFSSIVYELFKNNISNLNNNHNIESIKKMLQSDNFFGVFVYDDQSDLAGYILGEFKKGAFHIAKNTGVSIVPVIINGAYEAKNKSDWRLSPGKINIHFSNIINFDLYADMSINELRDYVRGKIKDFVD